MDIFLGETVLYRQKPSIFLNLFWAGIYSGVLKKKKSDTFLSGKEDYLELLCW